MSSTIVARAAFRTAARRNFSVLHTLRDFGRSLEPHGPFERLPASQRPQAADWSKMLRARAIQLAIYFPGFAAILGWPYLGKIAFDGQMGKL